MGHSIGSSALQTPANALPSRSQGQAKADLESRAVQSEFSDVLKCASRRVFTKQEAAAAHVGKTPGTYSRDIDAGTMRAREMAELGPEFLAEVGRELVERYAPLSTPQARLRQKARELRAIAEEIDQASEMVA